MSQTSRKGLRRGSTPLRRGSRIRPVSKKVQRGRAAFQAVYDEVDVRSGGRCEVVDLMETIDSRRGRTIGTEFHEIRCHSRAVEHHHLFKPRRAHHTVGELLHVCRSHHEQFEAPYRLGRRVPIRFDDALGRHDTEVIYAASKWEARQTGAV